MSCNYADGLSPYHDKGQLGLEEKFDSKSVVSAKVSLLTKWINEAKHVVIHTGAGISTSAGIPDFRGPRGVWTLQEKGEKPDLSKDFNDAIPTVTHMAIMKLVEREKVKYVVSQNIDGLHLRSNLQRKYLSELHGNMFTEQCNSCNRQFVRSSPVPTVGQKSLNKACPATKANGRPCRGRLHDTILDWEHNLPENDLGMADYHSCLADLSISLGTTMQIVPSGNLPLYTKRNGGKLVIVNLQPTKHDRKANLLIHSYVDDVMTLLMKNLNIKIPKYAAKYDPTRIMSTSSEKFLEWTISDYALKKMKKMYEEKCGSKEARKRLEMIYDDVPLSIAKNLKRKVKEEEDSDLEVLDVIVKPKRTRESSRRSSKKNSAPVYNTTITIKKVTSPPPKKSAKYEGEKITIKKNVTPTKTKYEIVTKPKKLPKCEIVYDTGSDLCNDLDMICESDDDDEMTNNFTYNFKMYLKDDDKKVIKSDVDKEERGEEVKTEFKNETKVEEGNRVEAKVDKSLDDSKEEIKRDGEKERKTKTEPSEEASSGNNTDLIGGKEVVDEPEEGTSRKEDNDGEAGERVKSENESKIGREEANDGEGNENEAGEIESIDEISSRPNESKSNEEEAEMKVDGNSPSEGATVEMEKKRDEGKEMMEDDEKPPATVQEKAVPAEMERETSSSKSEEEKSKPEESSSSSSKPEEAETETEKSMHEEEIKKLISKTGEEESDSKESGNAEIKENGSEKLEMVYTNIESELSNLSNSNLESQIDRLVDETEPTQFNAVSSMEMTSSPQPPPCNDNSAIDFYHSEYNSSNNATDFDNLVDESYYNNF